MKIYTKGGDKQTSALYDGTRLPKSNDIFELLGHFDELSVRIGLVCAHLASGQIPLKYQGDQETVNKLGTSLRSIQVCLQTINSKIATVDKVKNESLPEIQNADIRQLEESIDTMESANEPLTAFILSGVQVVDACVHMCRTQTRLVERHFIKFYYYDENTPYEWQNTTCIYLNRLSDYFFVLARYLCTLCDVKDYIAY